LSYCAEIHAGVVGIHLSQGCLLPLLKPLVALQIRLEDGGDELIEGDLLAGLFDVGAVVGVEVGGEKAVDRAAAWWEDRWAAGVRGRSCGAWWSVA
jgi:hypothetical protein